MAIDAQREQIKERLERARRNLLDTSLRNRLLNYKPSRQFGLEAKGESPEEIFDILYRQERTMRFRGRPDEAPSASDRDLTRAQAASVFDFEDPVSEAEFRAQAEEELDSFVGTIAHHNAGDYVFDCPYQNKELVARLRTTFRNMRKSIEEQGVNILFVALGMLNWKESSESETVRKAPLILIPVELAELKSGPHRLKYNGEEAGPNLPLAEKLRNEFGIRMPEVPDDLTAINLENYFTDVRQAIRSKSEWFVDDETVVLSFFSFAKYLIYVDLGGGTWPVDKKPWDHPILAGLLSDEGFERQEPAIPDGQSIDAVRSVDHSLEVVDADSSQLRAILEATDGKSMVIQGPPGTGKSQTITNLVAEFVGLGKSVLFVAEKMAALNVVYENLRRVGLHELCLEIHSQKTNKREFYDEIRRTLELGKPSINFGRDELELLQLSRDELNDYCAAVSSIVEPFKVSPFVAMGRLSQLPEASEGSLKLPCSRMKEWSGEEFKTALGFVEKLQHQLRQKGMPAENPFYGSRVTLVMPEDKHEIAELVSLLRASWNQYVEVARELATAMELPTPTSLKESEFYSSAAKFAVGAPDFDGVMLQRDDWLLEQERLGSAIESISTIQGALREWAPRVVPNAWGRDLNKWRAALAEHASRFFRWFSRDYRVARREARALFLTPRQPDRVLLELCDAVMLVQQERTKLEEVSVDCKAHFGAQWQAEDSNADHLRKVLTWVVQLKTSERDGTLPDGVVRALQAKGSSEHLKAPLLDYERGGQELGERFEKLKNAIKGDGRFRALLDQTFADFEARLESMGDGIERLTGLASFNVVAQEARDIGLDDTVLTIESEALAAEEATIAFERKWYSGVLKVAWEQRPPLKRFDRDSHEAIAEQFKRLDDLMLKFNRAKVADRHWESVQNIASWDLGEVGWLKTQCAKKRGQKPIRQAMESAGTSVRRLKPVFMMSPLSVASYLGDKAGQFDVVIFDEASQVKPEDAFGAILRAPQTIVVGDSKQLPPTSFFDDLTRATSDDEEEEQNVTRDIESVLSLMDSKVAHGSPQRRMLEWHYRSRHHTLIAVSNAEFYDGRLYVFPSPSDPHPEFGLRLHHLPDTVYGRAGSRRNPLEAKAVVRAAYEHAKNDPGKSLGIVAFSQSQAEAIEDMLDSLRHQDPVISSFEERHPHERLFVKNLESVQGDERDVIFVSVGYGRDREGRLTMNFGPLNQDGGERRLNVLVTRSRMRCEVFCNFRSSDLKVAGDTGRGVKALKTYIHYAETGDLVTDAPSGRPTGSPFEDSVIDFLRGQNIEVEPQVGVAGFFVDIGVRHPKNLGDFVLGIECDGASYHSSRSARDRDKLRQRDLEKRGWRIHRVWSTDWWLNRSKEQRRLLEAINRAVQLAEGGDENRGNYGLDDVKPSPVEFTRIDPEPIEPNGLVPDYVQAQLRFNTYGQQLRDVPTATLIDWIVQVLAVESPIHYEELVRRIRVGAGFGRAGRLIRESVSLAISHGARTRRLEQEGDFVWRVGKNPIVVRNRGCLDQQSKNIEFIHPAEIEATIALIVERSIRIDTEDLAQATLRTLGFERATTELLAPIRKTLDVMAAREQVLISAGTVLKR